MQASWAVQGCRGALFWLTKREPMGSQECLLLQQGHAGCRQWRRQSTRLIFRLPGQVRVTAALRSPGGSRTA